jgi:hypothetical protein
MFSGKTSKSVSDRQWQAIPELHMDSLDFAFTTMRCWVPGGWLVQTVTGGVPALTFVPDSKHEWSIPSSSPT